MATTRKNININPSDDDFGLVLNCAVRYALGRRTYMPSAIVSFINPMLPMINDRTLHCLDQDIADAKYEGGYGDECDEKVWLQFHDAVKTERMKRGQKLYVNWREK